MPTPTVNSERLLERFLRYVRIGTAADADSQNYPSTPGQLALGKLLVGELIQMGASQVEQDRHGLVWATIPATVTAPAPTILFNAHLDTSPEAPGEHVNPQVVREYEGGDIALPNGDWIRESDCQDLVKLKGHCLITTDGTTLLGGDDKAGVAAIMELAEHLLENPALLHGEVRILFTCDEEIGRGAQYFDLGKAAAVAGYTLDGAGHSQIENENFSADQIVVKLVGHNIHPAIAKGKMVNAVRAMACLIDLLPYAEHSPESTEGKQGFLHPYHLSAGVGEAELRILLRDFQTSRLDELAELVQERIDEVLRRFPGIRASVERVRQYRNMADALAKHPHVVQFALDAHATLEHEAELGSIRGGTDGAMMSELGLPTPNLSVGQHNIHSVREFASLDEMVMAVEHAIRLLAIWQASEQSTAGALSKAVKPPYVDQNQSGQ